MIKAIRNNAPGVLGDAPLVVAEIGGDGDHRPGDGPDPAFGVVLEPLEDQGGQRFRGVLPSTDGLVVESLAHVAFEIEGHQLGVLGEGFNRLLADDDPAVRPDHHRRRCNWMTVAVFDGDGRALGIEVG